MGTRRERAKKINTHRKKKDEKEALWNCQPWGRKKPGTKQHQGSENGKRRKNSSIKKHTSAKGRLSAGG